MKAIVRKNIVFTGRVQGVGFRYQAYGAAKECGLTGWVQNLYDGTVELEAQGKEADIERLILSLDQGSHIQIAQMHMKDRPLETKENSFQILT